MSLERCCERVRDEMKIKFKKKIDHHEAEAQTV